MNDTDRTHKENKLEQDITLPYLKKAVIFSITFGFCCCCCGGFN